MDQIFTHCVAPAHVSPNISVRVVLVEQVIFTSIEDRAVGSFMKWAGGVK